MVNRALFNHKGQNIDKWLHYNIFLTTCTIGKKVCRMVINSSSYKNLISEEAITKLNLKMESYRTLYIVKRLKKTNYVMVKKWC